MEAEEQQEAQSGMHKDEQHDAASEIDLDVACIASELRAMVRKVTMLEKMTTELQALCRNHKSSWQEQAAELLQMKDHVNKLEDEVLSLRQQLRRSQRLAAASSGAFLHPFTSFPTTSHISHTPSPSVARATLPMT